MASQSQCWRGAHGFGGDTARALGAIEAPAPVMAPPLDLYNPVEAAQWAAAHIRHARFVEIPSDWGHQSASAADNESASWLNRQIREFLELRQPG